MVEDEEADEEDEEEVKDNAEDAAPSHLAAEAEPFRLGCPPSDDIPEEMTPPEPLLPIPPRPPPATGRTSLERPVYRAAAVAKDSKYQMHEFVQDFLQSTRNLSDHDKELVLSFVRRFMPPDSEIPNLYGIKQALELRSRVRFRELLSCPRDDHCAPVPLREMTATQLGLYLDEQAVAQRLYQEHCNGQSWKTSDLESFRCPKCKIPMLDENGKPKVSSQMFHSAISHSLPYGNFLMHSC